MEAIDNSLLKPLLNGTFEARLGVLIANLLNNQETGYESILTAVICPERFTIGSAYIKFGNSDGQNYLRMLENELKRNHSLSCSPDHKVKVLFTPVTWGTINVSIDRIGKELLAYPKNITLDLLFFSPTLPQYDE